MDKQTLKRLWLVFWCKKTQSPIIEFIFFKIFFFVFCKKTSLKIFKHYKLKPSFPIIKDNKTKDMTGWGTSPHPQILASQLILIWYNFSFSYPTDYLKIKNSFIWTNFIWLELNNQSDSSWSILIQFESVWTNLIQVDLIWSNLNWFGPIWTNFIWLEPNTNQPNPSWSFLIQFEPIWSSLIHFGQIWSNLIQNKTAFFILMVNVTTFYSIILWSNRHWGKWLQQQQQWQMARSLSLKTISIMAGNFKPGLSHLITTVIYYHYFLPKFDLHLYIKCA